MILLINMQKIASIMIFKINIPIFYIKFDRNKSIKTNFVLFTEIVINIKIMVAGVGFEPTTFRL